MNNKKILVVGILAIIVTMMVGYALFSETITINGTATAKGDFDITATCQKGVSDNIKNVTDVLSHVEAYGEEGGYSNDICTVNGNTVSFGANLKYPGTVRRFTITFKNTGSITAVLGNLTGDGKMCYDSDNDNVAENCTEGLAMAGILGDFPVALIKQDGTVIDVQDDEADISDFLDENDNLILKPGNSLVYLGLAFWDSKIDMDRYNGVLLTSESTYTLEFTQITN